METSGECHRFPLPWRQGGASAIPLGARGTRASGGVLSRKPGWTALLVMRLLASMVPCGHMSFLPPRSRHQREALRLTRAASFRIPVHLPCFSMLLLLQIVKGFSNNTKHMLCSRHAAFPRLYYLFISAPFRAQCPALLGKINERKAISRYSPSAQLSGSLDLPSGAAPAGPQLPALFLALFLARSARMDRTSPSPGSTAISIRSGECFRFV